MIKKLGIKNFKSFGGLEYIDFKPITLMSGLNSSGKSSVYQSLLVLSQSMDSLVPFGDSIVPSLRVNGEYVRVGRKRDLLNDPKDPEVFFEIETDGEYAKIAFFLHSEKIDNEVNEEFILKSLHYRDQEAELEISLNEKNTWDIKANKFVHFVDYNLGRMIDVLGQEYLKKKLNKDLSGLVSIYSPKVEFKNVKKVVFKELMLHYFEIQPNDFEKCLDTTYKGLLKPGTLKYLLDLHGISYTNCSLQNSNDKTFVDELSKKRIEEIPPFRGRPERVYAEGVLSNPLKNFKISRSNRIPYFYDLEKKEPRYDTVENALNFWISEYFKISDGVKIGALVSDYATEIMLMYGNKEVSINNMGFGVSQVLPIIYKVLAFEHKSIFIVDEPEVHLHPKAQSTLGDFFFHMGLIGKNLVIETHSEGLLNKMIYLNVKYEEHKNKTKMIWVDRSQGKAKVRDISYDDYGYIIDSPEGFLDERKKIADELAKIRLEKINS